MNLRTAVCSAVMFAAVGAGDTGARALPSRFSSPHSRPRHRASGSARWRISRSPLHR